jgi:hypothetical protein
MEEQKQKLVDLIKSGSAPASVSTQYAEALNAFLAAGGSKEDPVVAIGAAVYGCALPAPAPKAKAATPADCIIPFDYMNSFMKDSP